VLAQTDMFKYRQRIFPLTVSIAIVGIWLKSFHELYAWWFSYCYMNISLGLLLLSYYASTGNENYGTLSTVFTVFDLNIIHWFEWSFSFLPQSKNQKFVGQRK